MNVVVDTRAWLHALEGGMMIGLAAAFLLLFNGRIAGVSGVFGGLLFGHGDTGRDRAWRLLFVLGLIAGAWLAIRNGSGVVPVFASTPAGWGLVAAGGLLVGFGTRMGNGCTSGHGVCGLARGSRRSLAATLTFMACGALAVWLVRHFWGLA